MADTQRTRAEVLALFADNSTGQISAQDLRDFVVTIMNTEFAFTGDFWAQPTPDSMTADKTIRGWIAYSQIIVSAVSFGRVVYMTSAGWACAGASATADHAGKLGVVGNSYAAAESQAQVLLAGLVWNTSHAAILGSRIGNLLYLASGQLGSIASTPGTSVVVLGYAERSAVNDTGATTGKWRFMPQWGVTTI